MIQQQEVPVKFYSEFCGCVNVVQIEHMSIVFQSPQQPFSVEAFAPPPKFSEGGGYKEEQEPNKGYIGEKKEGFVLDLNNGTRRFLGAIDETTLFFFTVCIGGTKCVNLRSTFFLTD